MSRQISQLKALQYALDAMCSFDQSKLSLEESQAIDIIADMIAKRQLYERSRKDRYEGQKYYKKVTEGKINQ